MALRFTGQNHLTEVNFIPVLHEARYPGATVHAYRGIKRSYDSCYSLSFCWFCLPGRPSDRNYIKKFQPGKP